MGGMAGLPLPVVRDGPISTPWSILSTEMAPPRSFRVRGRGWGHGVGLCQVGACSMATKGKTAAAILAHYYPGTRLVR